MAERKTSRLVLSPLTEKDWPDFLSLYCDVQVGRFICEAPTEAQVRQKFIVRLGGPFFVIRRHGEFVGDIGLTISHLYPQQADIGYALLPNAWGKGYAQEALQTICDYGFTSKNLVAINAWVLAENVGSVRVLEKTGFRRTQVLEKAFMLNGVLYDDWVYCLEK